MIEPSTVASTPLMSMPCPPLAEISDRSSTKAPPIPVFVRLADLVPLLEDRDALRHDDHRWLLDYLERLSTENHFAVARGAQLGWHPDYMRHRFDNWVGGLNGDWLVPLPAAFTSRQAMAIGTAGYTAMLVVSVR